MTYSSGCALGDEGDRDSVGPLLVYCPLLSSLYGSVFIFPNTLGEDLCCKLMVATEV